MSIILAIETSTGPCSVALWKNGGIAAYLENSKPVMQSASLIPMIEEALVKSGTQYQDLSAIACTIGPGSFTGIRVGLAAARGIAFAAKIKTLGFTTLETLAFAARVQSNPITAIINAGKGEVYYQHFASGPFKTVSEACLGKLESIENKGLVIGNVGVEKITFPRADALAELAATRAQFAHPPAPFYIRPPDAKPQQDRPLGF